MRSHNCKKIKRKAEVCYYAFLQYFESSCSQAFRTMIVLKISEISRKTHAVKSTLSKVVDSQPTRPYRGCFLNIFLEFLEQLVSRTPLGNYFGMIQTKNEI